MTNIFNNDVKNFIQKHELEDISDHLFAILIDHQKDDDKTVISETSSNTLYICGTLSVYSESDKVLLDGYEVFTHLLNKGFSEKEIIEIVGSVESLENQGFEVHRNPFYEIMNNSDDDFFSEAFESIPTRNLDIFIDDYLAY